MGTYSGHVERPSSKPIDENWSNIGFLRLSIYQPKAYHPKVVFMAH
jgi:hypothetical protein